MADFKKPDHVFESSENSGQWSVKRNRNGFDIYTAHPFYHLKNLTLNIKVHGLSKNYVIHQVLPEQPHFGRARL